jgi:hypothetical protein
MYIYRAGILSTYANFFLSFIRREASKKHGFTLLRWLVFELSDAISEHFIRSMLKNLSWDRCFLDAKTTFLAKSVKKCINFAFFSQKFSQKFKFFFKFSKNKKFQKIFKKKFKKSILTDNLTRFLAYNLEKHLLALLTVLTNFY